MFSNHGHVLLFLAGNTEARLRDVAGQVGITERAVQKIVRELQDAGYLSVTKHGRCNRYQIHGRKTLRHPIESHCTLSRLVGLVHRSPSGESEPAAESAVVSAPKNKAKPKSRTRSKPAPRPQQQPQAKSATRPEAQTVKDSRPAAEPVEPPAASAPEPASGPVPEPPQPAPAKRRGKKNTEAESEPAETRQQGSLF
ncbi:hypothetical protein V3330_03155 [Wenzhouxiangellaceae bacterium CH-27]|uniref:HTH marR-type domain-containing protein n=1 Tax=Elongatibacter sediminis TaxID=3119006 RepID=A0AAW9RDW4_9GAMM